MNFSVAYKVLKNALINAITILFCSIITYVIIFFLLGALGTPNFNPWLIASLSIGISIGLTDIGKSLMTGSPQISRVLIGIQSAFGLCVPIIIGEIVLSPGTSPLIGTVIFILASVILIIKVDWSNLLWPSMKFIFPFLTSIGVLAFYSGIHQINETGQWLNIWALLFILLGSLLLLITVAPVIFMISLLMWKYYKNW